MKIKTIIEMDCEEFNDIVRDIYNQEQYEFVIDEEAHNYSSYTSTVDGSVNSWDSEDINKFIESGDYSMLWQALLEDLAFFEILPKGEYLIKVFW